MWIKVTLGNITLFITFVTEDLRKAACLLRTNSCRSAFWSDRHPYYVLILGLLLCVGILAEGVIYFKD